MENILWKKWLLIFQIHVFENRQWFVSVLTNHPTDRKYQFESLSGIKKIVIDEGNAWGRMGVDLGKNNLSIYFFRYIEYIDIFLVINRTYQISRKNCDAYPVQKNVIIRCGIKCRYLRGKITMCSVSLTCNSVTLVSNMQYQPVPVNISILSSHQKNVAHQSYRWQVHMWMDKRNLTLME